ncbi:hypothetical protein BGZ83_004956 [Gryganskiella cystojenkinii]|nr:hypothetical protein BGZ83_004956 [Gryganskiella cystojenkinii]
MMIALLALLFCASSTVQAADYDFSHPSNCTAWSANCRILTDLTYGNGKNGSYTSDSAICANSSSATAAQPLCQNKVTCYATFMNFGAFNAVINAAGNTTTSSTTAGTVPTATSSSGPKPSGVYSVGSIDMTAQLLKMYDTSKCSAAAAQAVTSAVAVAIVATVLSVMSFAL